jgi:hypothetical protein
MQLKIYADARLLGDDVDVCRDELMHAPADRSEPDKTGIDCFLHIRTSAVTRRADAQRKRVSFKILFQRLCFLSMILCGLRPE